MAKVWVGVCGYYSDTYVSSVFSTKEKGEQWIKEQPSGLEARIYDYELDKAETYSHGELIVKQY